MSRSKNRQLLLDVRLYRVRCDGWIEIDIQARTAAAAKYQVFKKAREAGFFSDPRSGFRDFLTRGFHASEVRR